MVLCELQQCHFVWRRSLITNNRYLISTRQLGCSFFRNTLMCRRNTLQKLLNHVLLIIKNKRCFAIFRVNMELAWWDTAVSGESIVNTKFIPKQYSLQLHILIVICCSLFAIYVWLDTTLVTDVALDYTYINAVILSHNLLVLTRMVHITILAKFIVQTNWWWSEFVSVIQALLCNEIWGWIEVHVLAILLVTVYIVSDFTESEFHSILRESSSLVRKDISNLTKFLIDRACKHFTWLVCDWLPFVFYYGLCYIILMLFDLDIAVFKINSGHFKVPT